MSGKIGEASQVHRAARQICGYRAGCSTEYYLVMSNKLLLDSESDIVEVQHPI
jgi:hypothetical protein